METFSDFAYYSNEFCGTIKEDRYNRLAMQAYFIILSRTNNGAKNAPSEMDENLRICECEIVEAIHSFASQKTGVSSVNNDGYIVNYRDNAEVGERKIINELCERYLQLPYNLMSGWL